MKKDNHEHNKLDSTKDRPIDSITDKLIEGGVFKKLIFDDKGMVFKGQTTDTDRPNGIGRLELENGDFYEGEFHNGMFHGKGRLVQSGGKMYEGAWRNNKREGKGMEVWPDGKRYQGKFRNDKKNGYGKDNFLNSKVLSIGPMALATMATSMMTKWMASAFTNGPTGRATRESGGTG